jgi:hypothetical protein
MKTLISRVRKLENVMGIGKQEPLTIDKIEFTQEEVENYRKICMLYDEHVREYPDIDDRGEPGGDADLRERGLYWLRKVARAYGRLLIDAHLREKAMSVSGLSAWAKSIEELKKQRTEG